MRLIIAEKHSVGQAIAQAVGGHMEKHDGYVQVGDDLVTWAQGHLVDLCVCSIESGPCERVDVFHVSGRFWSTSACGEKRTPARPAWTSFPS